MYSYSHQPLFRCFFLGLAPQLGSYIFNCVPACVSVKSCPTLCDPVNCSLPGFSVHGISQARILEWVAVSPGDPLTQRSKPCLLHQQAGSSPLCHLGSPRPLITYTSFSLKARRWLSFTPSELSQRCSCDHRPKSENQQEQGGQVHQFPNTQKVLHPFVEDLTLLYTQFSIFQPRSSSWSFNLCGMGAPRRQSSQVHILLPAFSPRTGI